KVLEVLDQAANLITPAMRDSQQASKVAEVLGNRSWAYMERARLNQTSGDLLTAAVYGEALVEQMPPVPKAAAGGFYALQAYARMIGDPAADPKSIQTDTDRMFALAVFMEKTWPNDPNTDFARYLVGTMLLRPPKPNPKEAAAILSRVSDGLKPAGALV